MVVVKEFNEFTWDMVRGLPKLYHHYKKNQPVTMICKSGLSSIYSNFATKVIEKNKFDERNDARTYSHSRPWFTQDQWSPPPVKESWKGYLTFDKPTVVIQNKFALESQKGPFNFFPLPVLDNIFNELKDKYQIVYIRPRGVEKKYFTDDNKILKFDDYDLIHKNHQYVVTIEDLMREYPKFDFNQLQFAIHATSDRHISVSGGNACLSAYFGGDLIIYDSPKGKAGRGIWKTDSWLNLLSNSNIYGVNSYDNVLSKIKELW